MMQQMIWEPVKSRRELAALLVWTMVNDQPIAEWSKNDAKIREYVNSQANWVYRLGGRLPQNGGGKRG